jgi:hypothetical protein
MIAAADCGGVDHPGAERSPAATDRRTKLS